MGTRGGKRGNQRGKRSGVRRGKGLPQRERGELRFSPSLLLFFGKLKNSAWVLNKEKRERGGGVEGGGKGGRLDGSRRTDKFSPKKTHLTKTKKATSFR